MPEDCDIDNRIICEPEVEATAEAEQSAAQDAPP